MKVSALLPFVPSGADYDAARQFFGDVGFEELWENSGYAGFRNGNAQFILQKFDDEKFAANFMIRIDVPNLDEWWETISNKDLPGKYPGVRFNPPANFPWGREVNFIDLAGVCWHVGQG